MVLVCGVILFPGLTSAANSSFKDVAMPQPFLLPSGPGPSISDMVMTSDGSSLRVIWKTDSTSTGRIEYGTTDAYGKILEDKTLAMDHALTISTATGTLHLRISSDDVHKKTSATADIAIAIPEPVTPTSTLPSFNATTTRLNATSTAHFAKTPTTTATVIATTTKTTDSIASSTSNEPVQPPSSGLSLTDAALGGLGVLVAGVLIGLIFKGR
jgi:hypothetical protein